MGRTVEREVLSDLLDLHDTGIAVAWPPGYSLDTVRKELGLGGSTSSAPSGGGQSLACAPSMIAPPVAKDVPTTPAQIATSVSTPKPGRGEVWIYTDGSCPSNVGAAAKQGAAGWGFVALRGEGEMDFYGPVVFDKADPLFLGCSCGTNNTGELSAVGMALRWLVECDLSSMPCTIFYDSKYAANIAQAVWKAEKNEDLARTVQGFLRVAKAARRIVFKHVKGHSGNVWNERADKNAERGAAGELKCWERPPTALYKPQNTLQNMFGKRPSQSEDTNKGKKPRQDSSITFIEGGGGR
eukprot:TRINITY_DN12099_c0_g1_i1.p1 TRINITY_DN12099_c0_g1~~TRINITY_DN12099_c0_g1_i1.p1  ORF type:complete len:297 (-),score=38.18 TRINITY_DN12099_c0_g1_i1:123-1013(-)